MKSKKVLGIAGIVVACIGVAGLLWAFIGDKKVSLTEAQLQSKIDAKMPFEQKGVHINDAHIDLSNDRINLSFEAATQRLGTDVKMHVTTIGNMRYDQKAGAFYFEPEEVRISNVHAHGIDIGGTVGTFVKKVGSKKIIEKAGELAEKLDKATQSAIQQAAAAALQRTPVYKLQDDFKGQLIHASLKKVEVQDHKVIAHISIWQLTLAVIGYILLIVIGIAILIMLCACPGLVDALFGGSS